MNMNTLNLAIMLQKLFHLLANSMNKKKSMQFAHWDITGFCNLRCKHCRAWKLTKANELSTKEGLNLLSQLKDLNVQFLNFSGGEPFLRKDIFELLDNARDFSTLTITTNGTLLTKDKIKKLKSFKNIRVSVSMDGLKEFHDNFRQVAGTFDKALESIKNLTTENIRTSVRSTLTNSNQKEVLSVFKLVSKYNLESFNIRSVIPSGKADALLMPDNVQYKDTIEKLMLFGENKGIPVISGDPILIPVFPQLLGKVWEEMGQKVFSEICAGCIAGDTAIYIKPNGDVGVCSYIPLIAGNIREKSLLKIINEEPLFKKLNDFRDKLKGKCGKCEFRDLCGGCRAVALSLNKNLFAEDPRCLISKFSTR